MPMSYTGSEPALSDAMENQGAGAKSGSTLAFPGSAPAPIPSQMPRGGTLSPAGDIGVLRQREARKVFKIPAHSEIQKASVALPAKPISRRSK